MDGATSYDDVEYPAVTYPNTHPSHLAAIARLHGLDVPDPARARVLEIAGGDGINVIGMAAGLPDAQFVNFDLARTMVERGAALIRMAGLDNAQSVVGDVLDWAREAEGQYDYVIVHGLYAWVPDEVREATLRLIDRVLSPTGIAFISYNAQPGGYLRMAVREMVLHEVAGLEGRARVEAAREALRNFARPREGERIVQQALRKVAAPMADKTPSSLFHDELNENYAPHSLSAVAERAARHNLAFLNDAVPKMTGDGFPGAGKSDAQAVAEAQASDFEAVTFFHLSLFVRPGREPKRALDHSAFGELYAVGRVRRTGGNEFEHEEGPFEIGDAGLADFLDELSAAFPARLPMARFADSPDHCDALFELYRSGIVDFHVLQFPGTLEPGERPVASPLVRALVQAEAPALFSLDHRVVTMQEGPRRFIALLDGTRDRAQLASEWAASEHGGEVDSEDAVRQLAWAGLILR